MNQMNHDDNFLLLKIVNRNINKIFNGKSVFLEEIFTSTLNSPTIFYTEQRRKKQIIIQLNGFYNCAEHRALNGHYFISSFFLLVRIGSLLATLVSQLST